MLPIDAVGGVNDEPLVVDGTSAAVGEFAVASELHGNQEGILEGQEEVSADDAQRSITGKMVRRWSTCSQSIDSIFKRFA